MIDSLLSLSDRLSAVWWAHDTAFDHVTMAIAAVLILWLIAGAVAWAFEFVVDALWDVGALALPSIGALVVVIALVRGWL